MCWLSCEAVLHLQVPFCLCNAIVRSKGAGCNERVMPAAVEALSCFLRAAAGTGTLFSAQRAGSLDAIVQQQVLQSQLLQHLPHIFAAAALDLSSQQQAPHQVGQTCSRVNTSQDHSISGSSKHAGSSSTTSTDTSTAACTDWATMQHMQALLSLLSGLTHLWPPGVFKSSIASQMAACTAAGVQLVTAVMQWVSRQVQQHEQPTGRLTAALHSTLLSTWQAVSAMESVITSLYPELPDVSVQEHAGSSPAVMQLMSSAHYVPFLALAMAVLGSAVSCANWVWEDGCAPVGLRPTTRASTGSDSTNSFSHSIWLQQYQWLQQRDWQHGQPEGPAACKEAAMAWQEGQKIEFSGPNLVGTEHQQQVFQGLGCDSRTVLWAAATAEGVLSTIASDDRSFLKGLLLQAVADAMEAGLRHPLDGSADQHQLQLLAFAVMLPSSLQLWHYPVVRRSATWLLSELLSRLPARPDQNDAMSHLAGVPALPASAADAAHRAVASVSLQSTALPVMQELEAAVRKVVAAAHKAERDAAKFSSQDEAEAEASSTGDDVPDAIWRMMLPGLYGFMMEYGVLGSEVLLDKIAILCGCLPTSTALDITAGRQSTQRGVLLAWASNAGTGSPEQSHLYSMLASLLKFSSTIIAAAFTAINMAQDRDDLDGCYQLHAVAASNCRAATELLVHSRSVVFADDRGSKVGSSSLMAGTSAVSQTGSSDQAAHLSCRTSHDATNAVQHCNLAALLPSLVLLGRCFLQWARLLPSIAEEVLADRAARLQLSEGLPQGKQTTQSLWPPANLAALAAVNPSG